MKINSITRIDTAARFPQKAAAAGELARQARIVHHITPSGVGVHSTTTTIATTLTTTATDSAPEYQATVERFTLRSASADQSISEAEEAAAAAHLSPAPVEQGPAAGPVGDHLLHYFHAVETARLARFLASAKVARNARADKAVQLAQAYANHE